MGLFTNPVVLDTRSFSFRSQQQDKKSVVGDYIEDAASIAAESLLTVKHDSTGTTPRHLLQRSIWRVPAAATDGILRRITVNLTITADKLFTAVEVQDELDIIVDACGETGFVSGMLTSKL